eukprot:10914341-Karenia_brevis.AAC.1
MLAGVKGPLRLGICQIFKQLMWKLMSLAWAIGKKFMLKMARKLLFGSGGHGSEFSKLPISESKGVPRVPKLQNQVWSNIATQVFTSESRVVVMTDGAGAYDSVEHPGIVEKHSVNHQKKIFARSVSILGNTQTMSRRTGVAGTMAIDVEWRYLKSGKPK